MTSQPLRDNDVYDLTDDNVVQFSGPLMDHLTATPVAVLAAPDALLPQRKKPGRKPGSKNKKSKKAKSAASVSLPAQAVGVPGVSIGTPAPGRSKSLLTASAGDAGPRTWRRIFGIDWLIVAAVMGAVGIGASIAVLVVR